MTFRAIFSFSQLLDLPKLNGSRPESADSLPHVYSGPVSQDTPFSPFWSPRWLFNAESEKVFCPPARLSPGLASCATSADGQAQFPLPLLSIFHQIFQILLSFPN